MPLDFMVPVDKRDWKYFDRQRSVFKNTYENTTKGKSPSLLDDDMTSFDEELARVKRDLFQLKSIDFGSADDFRMKSKFDDDFGFGKDFPFDKSSSDLLQSMRKDARSDKFGKLSKDFDLSKELVDMGFDKDIDDVMTRKKNSGGTIIESSSTTETSHRTSDKSARPGGSARDVALTTSSPSSLSDTFLKVENPIVESADGKKRLALRFDVSMFKPEEITVRVKDNTLAVVAEHREETATSKVYKKYTRQYVLPQKIAPEKLTSILSADGVLDIEGPAPENASAVKIRVLPINLL